MPAFLPAHVGGSHTPGHSDRCSAPAANPTPTALVTGGGQALCPAAGDAHASPCTPRPRRPHGHGSLRGRVTHGPELTMTLRTRSKLQSARFRHSAVNSICLPWKFSCSKTMIWGQREELGQGTGPRVPAHRGPPRQLLPALGAMATLGVPVLVPPQWVQQGRDGAVGPGAVPAPCPLCLAPWSCHGAPSWLTPCLQPRCSSPAAPRPFGAVPITPAAPRGSLCSAPALLTGLLGAMVALWQHQAPKLGCGESNSKICTLRQDVLAEGNREHPAWQTHIVPGAAAAP